VTKFKKIRFHSHENIGYGDISLPEEEMHTRSLMLVFDGGTRTGSLFSAASEEEKAQIIAGLGSLYRQMAPFFLLCDSRDIGVSERLKEPHFDAPALFFFDQYPGGTGLAEKFLDSLDLIGKAASHLLRSCPCEEGCPSCIGPRDRTVEITANPKKALVAFLDALEGGTGS